MWLYLGMSAMKPWLQPKIDERQQIHLDYDVLSRILIQKIMCEVASTNISVKVTVRRNHNAAEC